MSEVMSYPAELRLPIRIAAPYRALTQHAAKDVLTQVEAVLAEAIEAGQLQPVTPCGAVVEFGEGSVYAAGPAVPSRLYSPAELRELMEAAEQVAD